MIYIANIINERGNGYCIVNACNPKQVNEIIHSQSRYKSSKIVSFKELHWKDSDTHIIYEGAVTTAGKTDYELALASGFVGTVDEWLESLKGEKGEPGEPGAKGPKGDQGLKGDKGDTGYVDIRAVEGTNIGDFGVPTISADTFDIPEGKRTEFTFNYLKGNGLKDYRYVPAENNNDVHILELIWDNGFVNRLEIKNGRGIKDLSKTNTNGLEDEYTITFSDNTEFKFKVNNGKSINKVEKTGENLLIDTYTIYYNDNTTSSFDVTNGTGIASIVKVEEESDGFTDIYKVALTNGEEFKYSITNGISIVDVELKETSDDGLTNTYVINYSDGNTTEFIVKNGNGIKSIEQTKESSKSGEANEITVTLDNGVTKTFKFYNGQKGDRGESWGLESTYDSIEDMEADADNIPVGGFVLIVSDINDENNGKMYVKKDDGTFTLIDNIAGPQGPKGDTGVGIDDYTVETSDENSGENITTINLSDGRSIEIIVRNGDKGDKGDTGTGISYVENKFLCTNESSKEIVEEIADEYWTDESVVNNPTLENKYKWVKTTIHYDNDTTQEIPIHICGTYGDTGATPNLQVSADTDGDIGTPTVEVERTGTNEDPHFNFHFNGIKGEKGDRGDIGPKGDEVLVESTLEAGTKVGTITINGIPFDIYVPEGATYQFEQGDENGQFKVTSSKGEIQNVSIKGLGSLAFKDSISGEDVSVSGDIPVLDDQGKIPSSFLPSYVDDCVEYEGLDTFPIPGESGKIYIDTENNTTYRWAGSEYVSIDKTIALGETSSTAYAGDKGKALADLVANTSNASATLSLGNSVKVATVNGKDITIALPSSISWNNVSDKPTIPSNTNQLTNGAGYITSSGSITGNAATATTATNSNQLGGVAAGNYVRTDTAQTIAGKKTFSGGIAITSGDENANMPFFLGIDAYDAGGTVKYITANKVCAAIGAIPTSASCNKNWNWSGQGGQPTWLWGGNDANNVYVYNPSNFSVNNAANLGGVAAANYSRKATFAQVSGKSYFQMSI